MLYTYILKFTLVTAGMVALIYLLYLYYRTSPKGQLGHQPMQHNGPPLRIDSMLTLEPNKRLYVVGYANQRFLVSTTADKTEFLTTLSEEQNPLEALSNDQDNASTHINSSPDIMTSSTVSDGFWERFKASFKMVFQDRFFSSGRK